MPVDADVTDAFSVVKELYRQNYFNANSSALMFAISGGSISRVKEIMKAVVESRFAKKVIEQLEKHPTLSGVFKREDPSFIYKANEKAVHNGYQDWHRDYDKIFVDYLFANPDLSKAEFKLYMHKLHQQPSLRERFPKVNLKD
ncbi:hypothetical protein [Leptospira levettii]|uniref:hypothetical protein n=1 Tax=Leptospira levettii TaxID=2023178 RepID=UPI000C2A3215|nr:hypothetical protein [Leptospira levettii]PKA23063.1 hypothetical protein CH381_27710 [Leptospira sp. mixed culture ATI2-C-A1]TGM26467.1 hypothetical protein EHQ74_11190 [Leptospira levettii]TGM87980.1 hypothetical protein EHR00_00025 [Leptospira levettii]